jgi:hypothetical protein
MTTLMIRQWQCAHTISFERSMTRALSLVYRYVWRAGKTASTALEQFERRRAPSQGTFTLVPTAKALTEYIHHAPFCADRGVKPGPKSPV